MLAVLLPFTSVMPNLALPVSAAETQKDVTFHVYETEEVVSDTSQPTMVEHAIAGATVTINDDAGEKASAETDEDGKCTFTAFTVDDTKTYTYSVERTGYDVLEDQPIDWTSVADLIEAKLDMSKIELDKTSVGPLNPVGENNKSALVEIKNKIEGANTLEYVWSSDNDQIAKVDAEGNVTAVGKGKAVVSVSRNGKTQSIDVVVKENINGMTISATPGSSEGDSTTDIDKVEISVSGIPDDAKGVVTLYKGDVASGTKIVSISSPYAPYTYSDTDLKGNTVFTAVYEECVDDYYFTESVATKEISYKKTCNLALTNVSGTVTYGDVAPIILIDEDTVNGRELFYESSNTDVVTVDESGNLTIVKPGTANITIKAVANDEYTESSVAYTITVNKKELADVKFTDFVWEPVTKVYDGTAEVKMEGYLTAAENAGIIDQEKIIITADANVEKADAGEYGTCTIDTSKDYQLTGNAGNYDITFDDTDTNVSPAEGNKIVISKRPVYVQVEKKKGAFETTLTYGKSNAEIEELVKKDNKVVLVNGDGMLNAGAEEGLVGSDTLDPEAFASVKLKDLDTVYYVGTHDDAIQVNVTNEDAGNYKVCSAEGTDYYGRLQITAEELEDGDLQDRISVNVEAEGVVENQGAVWVRGNSEAGLSFELNDTNYDRIHVSKNGTDYTEFPGGQAIQFGEDEAGEQTLHIYLSNSENADTKTAVKDFTVNVDAKAPVVTFSGVGLNLDVYSIDAKIPFNIHKNAEYDIKISAEDAESGMSLLQTRVVTVDPYKDVKTQIADAIAEMKEDSTESTDFIATETINANGNYIILARVRDNVGNEAVYASNGMVFETNKPKVSIIVNGDEVIGEVTADKTVPYTITIDDTYKSDNANSGIQEIQVVVTDGGKEVVGSFDSENKVIDSHTITSEEIDKILGIATDDKTTLAYLEKRAAFVVNGELSVNKYHTGDVVLKVIAVDKAGNNSDELVKTVKLDNIAPQVQVRYDSYEAQQAKYFTSRTMFVDYTERNFSEDLLTFDVEINGEDKGTLTLAELNSIDGITVQQKSDSEETVTNPDDYTDERVVTYQIDFVNEVTNDVTNGAYKIIPHAEDTAGNKSGSVTYEQEENETYQANELFVIDSKEPEIEVSYNDNVLEVSNGRYFKSPRQMTITYTERNFNQSLLSFNVTVDGTETEDVSFADLGKTLGEDVVITAMTDSESAVIESAHTDSRTNSFTITFGKEGKDHDYSITPYITDNAGNQNTTITDENAEVTTGEVFTVDMALPQIKASYNDKDIKVSNGAYFNAPREMTITYTERNFDLSCLTFDVMADENKQTSVTFEGLSAVLGTNVDVQITDMEDSEAGKDENAHTDSRTNKFTITFGAEDKDHDYSIMPHITDKAGNANEAVTDENAEVPTGDKFTVDMLAPTMSVSYQTVDKNENGEVVVENLGDAIGTEVQDSMYQNKTVEAVVTITERNFAAEATFKESIEVEETVKDVAGVDVEDADSEIKDKNDAAQAENEWTNDANVLDAKYQTFTFEKEANYTFNMTYTDMAGNTVQLVPDKDEENKSDGYYFTVDKTPPEGTMEITGHNDENVLKKLLDKIFFGFFGNKENQITVTTTSQDMISPVKTSYYQDYQDQHSEFAALAEAELNGLKDEEWKLQSGSGNEKYDIAKDVKEYSYKVGLKKQFVPYQKLEDKAGNVTYLNENGIVCEAALGDEAINIEIDTKAPNTSFKVAEEDVVYNGDVEFTINVKDLAEQDENGNTVYSGLSKITYEVYADKKSGVEGNESGEVTFPSEERVESYKIEKIKIPSANYNSNDITIEVTVTDNAGNTWYKTKELKIDTTKPKITVSYDNNNPLNEKYFNTDRKMTIVYTDRNINEEGLTFDFSAGGKEYSKITLEELRKLGKSAGIEILSESESEAVDSQKGAEVYTDERTLTYDITFNGGDSEDGDMDYKIIPYIEDQAGNVNQNENDEWSVGYGEGTKAPEAFTIDKAEPTVDVKYYVVGEENKEQLIDVSTNYVNRLYKNQTVRAVVTVNERNFSLETGFSDNGESGKKQLEPNFSWARHDGTNGSTDAFTVKAQDSSNWVSDGDSRELVLDFTEDGDYSVMMSYTDLAGNPLKVPYEMHYFTVDKTAPTMDVTYWVDGEEVSVGEIEENRFYQNKKITAKVKITERNFERSDDAEKFENGQMQLNYVADKTNEETDKLPVENYTESADTRNKWQTNEYVRTQEFEFVNDANYTFELSYKDLAGNNVAYGKHYFTVDKTEPTGKIKVRDTVWDKLLELVTFGFYTNTTEKVTLESDDITAGVKTTQYYKYIPDVESKGTFKALTLDELRNISDNKWTDGYSTSVNSDEQAIIYEKIVDKAGNVTYINTHEGIIADSEKPLAPEITITTAKPSQDIYKGNVNFTISVEDPTRGATYSGLQEVSYEVLKDNQVTQQGNYNGELSDKTARVKSLKHNETVNAQSNNSNNVTIRVTAKDYAGNVSTAEKKIQIDITKPTINVTYDLNNPLNEKYYKDTRTATVVVTERNFDPSAVRFDITNTDGTQPAISGWSSSADAGVSDNATHTCQVTFAADGDYTLTLNCTDKAGNDSEYTQVDEFTMDQTVPVIQVSYDNNDAKTAGYFKESRTATITVNEHNFNAGDINAMITASLQGQGAGAPSIGNWSGNGDVHTASVTFAADADYTFDVDYSDMAGNAAADYTQDKFTVDKTKPELEIFDIQDRSANNGTVAPGVRYSDVNYTEQGVNITLEGVHHDVKSLDGARSSVANGESIKMADFEHVEDMDDLYTLKAVIEDKAGNQTEQSVMFSVNRFGSVYVFSNQTAAFLDKYYSNEEQDLVITEINVDTLEFNGISYGRDGELVNLKQGEDYTVKASGSEASWKEYQYTVNKENFAQEGNYTVTIDSKDRAENVVNNKVKEKEVKFVIDKTKPTVVITGIENGAQYRTDKRDMTVNVTDNIAMGDVDIYVDDAEKPVKSCNASEIQESKGLIAYVIDNATNFQEIKAVARDAAGNEAETKNIRVLVTSNMFVQYYSNKPLFFGSIAGLAAVAAGIYFLIAGKKKKEK